MEVWKPVVGYEGLYEASSIGRIRSLPRTTTAGCILKQYVNKNGYCYVSLSKNNITHSMRVHKLVYEAFTKDVFDGYSKERTIDHKDGNKQNNAISNLECVTQSENQIRAVKLGLQKCRGIPVVNLDTKEIYNSPAEAAKSVGGNRGEMVRRVCTGKRSHYRGTRFAYLSDYEHETIPEFHGTCKKGAVRSLWR